MIQKDLSYYTSFTEDKQVPFGASVLKAIALNKGFFIKQFSEPVPGAACGINTILLENYDTFEKKTFTLTYQGSRSTSMHRLVHAAPYPHPYAPSSVDIININRPSGWGTGAFIPEVLLQQLLAEHSPKAYVHYGEGWIILCFDRTDPHALIYHFHRVEFSFGNLMVLSARTSGFSREAMPVDCYLQDLIGRIKDFANGENIDCPTCKEKYSRCGHGVPKTSTETPPEIITSVADERIVINQNEWKINQVYLMKEIEKLAITKELKLNVMPIGEMQSVSLHRNFKPYLTFGKVYGADLYKLVRVNQERVLYL